MIKILNDQKEKLIKGVYLKDDIIIELLVEIEKKDEEIIYHKKRYDIIHKESHHCCCNKNNNKIFEITESDAFKKPNIYKN